MRRYFLLALAGLAGIAILSVARFSARKRHEQHQGASESLAVRSASDGQAGSRAESNSLFDILIRIVDDVTHGGRQSGANRSPDQVGSRTEGPIQNAPRPQSAGSSARDTASSSSEPIERSPRTDTSSQLVVENTCTHAVELTWVTFEGTESVRATLQPGAMRIQGTYEGHLWRIRDAQDHSLLRAFASTRDDFVEVCDDESPLRNHAPVAHEARSSVCSSPSSVAMPLTIVNRCTAPVEVTWVGYECTDRHYRNLAPGESYVQQTYATHVWHGLDAASHVLATHVANPNVPTFEITCEGGAT